MGGLFFRQLIGVDGMVVRCGRTSSMAQLAYTAVVCCVGGLLLLSLAKSGQDSHLVVDALALNEELEFAAIQWIHGQLDDNADGTVDFQESEEFLQTELNETSEKSQRFHETDKEITSEDLWQSWHENKAFNWSVDDVLSWLESSVELPQYSQVFRKHNITGRHLPRIANNAKQVLQMVVGISDCQHKRKIQLRAMDVVLFGPPSGARSGYWKDIVVFLSSSLCLLGLLYTLKQRRSAQTRIDAFLESIRVYERELTTLKEGLEQQKEAAERGEFPPSEASSSSDQPDSPASEEEELSEECFSRSSQDSSLLHAHMEIQHLRQSLWSLEKQLEASRTNDHLLQALLQEAYKQEWENLKRRKQSAEEEMAKAQRVCDKIKRRRSSLLGTFHLANSSALEDAGMQITKAVNNMQKISEKFEEYRNRWKKIERLCGFLITSPTPPHTRHTSRDHLQDSGLPDLNFDRSHNDIQSPSQPTEAGHRGSICSLSSTDNLSFGRESPLFLGPTSSLPHRQRKSNSVPEITPLSSPTYVQLHRPQTALLQDSDTIQDGNSITFAAPSSSHSSLSSTATPSYNHQRYETEIHTPSSVHQTTPTSLMRRSTYPEAINTTDNGTHTHTDGGDTTLNSDKISKGKSGSKTIKRNSSLGAIKEERSPRVGRTQLPCNGVDCIGEESDGSGSERLKSSFKSRKKHKQNGLVKSTRSRSQ